MSSTEFVKVEVYRNESSMLQTQVLRVEQVNKPCIRLTQENLIENSVQDCLPYILKPYSLCYYYFGLP